MPGIEPRSVECKAKALPTTSQDLTFILYQKPTYHPKAHLGLFRGWDQRQHSHQCSRDISAWDQIQGFCLEGSMCSGPQSFPLAPQLVFFFPRISENYLLTLSLTFEDDSKN